MIENSLSENISQLFNSFWLRFVSQFLVVSFFFFAQKKGFRILVFDAPLSLSLSPSLTLSSPRQGSPFFGFRFVSFGFVELSFMLCLHSHTKGLNGILKEYGKRIASNRKNPEANRFFFLFSHFFVGFFFGNKFIDLLIFR